MYHYIKGFNKSLPYFNFLHFDDFKKQINYLEKKNLFFKIGDDLYKDYNKNKILLTFDDGLKEHLNCKIFEKKKYFRCLFYSRFTIKKI